MSRHAVGDIGILAKDLKVRCCATVIPKGITIEIHHQYSPNTVLVKIYPPVPFLGSGHSLIPVDAEAFRAWHGSSTGSNPALLSIDPATIPYAYRTHRVRLSSIWFEGESQP